MQKAKSKQRYLSWLISISILAFGSALPAQQLPSIRPRATSLIEAESLAQAFRAAANTVLPSVVKIRTTTNGRQAWFINGRFQLPDQEGLGSGVIIDPAGIVMTNNHVVKDADEVVVVMQDGTELVATEFTTDPPTDLAILRVSTKEPLPAARFGDSDALSVGDWVLAVGHPLELETSVSAGIISAKGRTLGQRIPRAQFLQTDAAINPGNSGGPLINLRGEVVGINTAIASQTGGYQGIGFAVPANLAKDVVSQLKDQGAVTRGYFGVKIQKLTKDLSDQLLDRSDYSGVLVNHVQSGTPAQQAGLRPGDVITHFAGYPVDSPAGLQRAVERVPIGSTQKVNFIRFGRPMVAEVYTLRIDQNQIDPDYRSVTKRLAIPVRNNSTLGFEVANLDDLARRQGLRIDQNAVVITRVGRDSLAAEKGLVPGMLVKQVRDQPVNSVAQFSEALRNESLTDGILLYVEDTRDGVEVPNRFVVVRAYQ